jgi:hypothetical protein
LILSHNLLWGEHLTQIKDKANKRLGILRSLKYKLNRLSLERIYLAYIRPLLEYGDIIWDRAPDDITDPLEAIQLNAARIVIGATARCSTEGLYKETAWEPLSKRREFHRLTLMFNIANGRAPTYLRELLPGQIQNRTGYLLRNRDQIDVPRTRLQIYEKSFFPSTIRLWNELDPGAKNAPSCNAFKARHKASLPPKNPLYYFGGRLEAAIHARLRIENSPLKADLCNRLHVIDSPLCPCGTGVAETAKHFFFECNLFTAQRTTLLANLLPKIIVPDNFTHLLFGIPNTDHLTNIIVFGAVHQFIRDTKRFY